MATLQVFYCFSLLLRLTGAYAFILFFHATLYDKFFPNRSDGQRDACRNGWWANMLYVNNFWHVGPGAVEVNSCTGKNLYYYKSLKDTFGIFQSQCLGVTWYMANDMQYFIISPLVFMPLFFFKTLGKTWSGIYCLRNFNPLLFLLLKLVILFCSFSPHRNHLGSSLHKHDK